MKNITIPLTYLLAKISNSNLNLPKINAPAGANGPVAKILTLVWIISAALSLLFVVIGGFKYTTSNGDPNQIASAKNTILYAVIGLVITIFAFTIVNFALSKVSG